MRGEWERSEKGVEEEWTVKSEKWRVKSEEWRVKSEELKFRKLANGLKGLQLTAQGSTLGTDVTKECTL